MIISPPFLLERQVDETDADYVARCMPDTSVMVRNTNTPEGSFAVSFALGWHGGLHLEAPINGQTRQNVRAIADGEIVYARRPTAHNDTLSPAEPRNYNPYDGGNGTTPTWTDDGCVILRHRTQIGANAEGRAVDVTFYSIYHHLSALRGNAHRFAGGATDQNRRVWRKDEIGTAGRVYGREHQLHFEIACDDANLERLIGRRTGNLNTGADGRRDVVFGELYFRLPAGTQIFAVRPLDNDPVAHHRPPNHPANQPAVPLAPAHTTQAPLIVGLRYAAGDGAANQRGSASLSTCGEDGTRVGEALPEASAEYSLHSRATAISASYPAGNRPAPSAVYELLRFGRIVDTAHETLTPANVPHWRQIATPEGTGWVNLNAEGVRKFSDADFPQWKGWRLIDDDTDADSRCESAAIIRMIENPADADGQLTRAELLQRLPLPEVRERLKRTLCKFPTEFNQATVEDRWGWLRNDPEFGLGEHFDEFAAHVRALAIPWDEGWLPNAHWHLPPREFIAIWRRCGWLSEGELRQLVPMRAVRGQGAGLRGPFFYERIDSDGTRVIRDHLAVLNRRLRKFSVISPCRLAAFVGNSVQETAWWSRMDERGGRNLRYAPWYGRGFLQLTNPDGQFSANSNYGKYFAFRGRNVVNVPANQLTVWQEAVATNEYDAVNSAGAYWAWNGANAEADRPSPNTRRGIGLAPNSQLRPRGSIGVYENVAFRRIACLINLPASVNSNNPQLNGLVDRYSAFANAQMVLYDLTAFPNAQGQMESAPEDFSPRRP